MVREGEKYEIDDIIINVDKFARDILKDEYYYKEIEKIIYFMFINKENINNCVDKIYELMKKLAKKALKSNNTIYLIELIHKITEFSCMDRKEYGIIVMISGTFNSFLLDVLSFITDQNETIVGVSSSGKIYKQADPEYY